MRNKNVLDMLSKMDDACFTCIEDYKNGLLLTKKQADNDAFLAFMALTKDEKRVFSKDEFITLMKLCKEHKQRVETFLAENGNVYGYVSEVRTIEMISNMFGMVKDAAVEALSLHISRESSFEKELDFQNKKARHAFAENDPCDTKIFDTLNEMEEALPFYVPEVMDVIDRIITKDVYELSDEEACILFHNPPFVVDLKQDQDGIIRSYLNRTRLNDYEVLRKESFLPHQQQSSWCYAVANYAMHCFGPVRENDMYQMIALDPVGKQLLEDKKTFNELFGPIANSIGYTYDGGYWLVEDYDNDAPFHEFACPTKDEIMEQALYGYPKSNPYYEALFKSLKRDLPLKEVHDFLKKLYNEISLGDEDDVECFMTPVTGLSLNDRYALKGIFESTKRRIYYGRTFYYVFDLF